MLTIVLFSIGAPILAGIGYLIMRDGRPQWSADMRGIALQTVIVIVVLLAIAGAVAGVLVARGGAEVQRLDEDAPDVFTTLGNQTDCEAAGGVWTATGGGSCAAP